MAYSKVHISNSTNYAVRGHVSYAACSGDDFAIQPMQIWTVKSRGVCLLNKTSATVYTPDHTVDAESYRSSGTSCSQFSIMQLDPGKYSKPGCYLNHGDISLSRSCRKIDNSYKILMLS